jgi:hypothetical protein
VDTKAERIVGGPYDAVIAIGPMEEPGFVRITARWERNGQAKTVTADVAGAISAAFADHWAKLLAAGEEPPS